MSNIGNEVSQNRVDNLRWTKEETYSEKWATRSREMLDLFVKVEANSNSIYRTNEFGCGPYAPFSTAAKDDRRFDVRKFDLRKWDNETTILDLNNKKTRIPKADIGVLSGVLEYVDKPDEVLRRLLLRMPLLLVSFVCVPVKALNSDEEYYAQIKHRSMRMGWRHHFSLPEFVSLMSKEGAISAVNEIGHNQHIFVLQRF